MTFREESTIVDYHEQLYLCVSFFVDGYRNRFKGKEDYESFSSSASRIPGKSDDVDVSFYLNGK